MSVFHGFDDDDDDSLFNSFAAGGTHLFPCMTTTMYGGNTKFIAKELTFTLL